MGPSWLTAACAFRYSSQRNQRAAASGAAIAHTISTTSSPVGNAAPGVSTARTVSDNAAAGSALANVSHRVGQLGERVRHAAEEQQHEEQPVGDREVRLGPQRAGEQHADAGERDRADEEQHHRERRARRSRPTRARCPVSTMSDRLHDFEREHVRASSRSSSPPRDSGVEPSRFSTPYRRS